VPPPTYVKSCRRWNIHVPSPQSYEQFANQSWWVDNGLLRLKIGSVVHEWCLESEKTGRLQLNRSYYDAATGRAVVGGSRFTRSAGFGYLSESSPRQVQLEISKAHLRPAYSGKLFKVSSSASPGQWRTFSNSLSTTVLRRQSNRSVLSYSYPCEASGSWCHVDLLINAARSYSSMLFYTNGGHDFDQDGCFNEFGHRTIYLGVWDPATSRVTRAVYVEYSYEDDGWPIIGAGYLE
jgi:hypothetical protein